MAKEKKARDTELTKEEMLPLDEEAQAALLDENEALKAECEAAQARLAQSEAQVQEEKERYLRLMAEYDNFSAGKTAGVYRRQGRRARGAAAHY